MAQLQLSSVALESLKPCSPNLMPFHVGYTGQAPVSTYFLVSPAKDKVGVPESQQLSVGVPAEAEATETPNDASKDSPNVNKTRFSASFRGRELRGLTVDLPEGYVGLVLKNDNIGTKKSLKEKIKGVFKRKEHNGRATRRATRQTTQVDDESDEEEIDGDMEVEAPAQNLTPQSHFSSFVVWNPDIPIDEGQDEYLRSLTEWIRLADVVSPDPAHSSSITIVFLGS